jgi:cytochrome c oxidase assembly protein subunit 11
MNPHGVLVRRLLLVCIAMFGFGFALVPLYDVFCLYTGINGKTANTPAQAATVMNEKRTIRVEFLANTDASIPWDFAPEVQQINLHPGEITIVNFHVENLSKDAMIGRAVPSVSPGEAARYFKKIECFCFTEQPLDAGQQKDMPVQFYIDPELPSHFTTITLSYRLYKSTPQTAAR